MGQGIHIILNLKMSKVIIVFIITLVSMESCHFKQDYLKSIVYDESPYSDNVILPLMVSTPDSLIRLICVTKINILSEIENQYNKNVAQDYLYNQILLKRPISVSLKYFNKHKDDCIYMDQDMYRMYKDNSISDFINHYFKKKNGTLVIYESDEMFPVKNQKPYKGFGHDINIELISYFLSMHDIYLSYVWIDEDCITRISIADKVSNMSLIE